MSGGPKRIFISDIHMGDSRGFQGTNPYGWFGKNVTALEAFLKKVPLDKDVKEMIILGDFFDRWVVPAHMSPVNSVESIFEANRPVIDALNDLTAKGIGLTYVPGNHDMCMSASEVGSMTKSLQQAFPRIEYLCDGSLTGKYEKDSLTAEHGHRYCLFNAPDYDTWADKGSCLPLGYFISRFVASKWYDQGEKEDVLGILKKFVHGIERGEDFIYNLVKSIAHDCGLEMTDQVNMDGVKDFYETLDIETIAQRYGKLTKNWERRRENTMNVDWFTAACEDGDGDLRPAIDEIYFASLRPVRKIVIFGHTHQWTPPYQSLHYSGGIPSHANPHEPYKAIYVNSGTWVDSSGLCTYVETQEDQGYPRHYVRVKEYPTGRILSEGFVETT